MRRTVLFTVFFYSCTLAKAQVTRATSPVAYTALTTYSTQAKDAFSAKTNAAALAGLKQFSAGVYAERRFMLQDLTTYLLAAALPTPSGTFGLRGQYAGTQLKETVIGLAYARKLGARVDVGVQFDYLSVAASGYGGSAALTFDAGAVIHLTDQLQTGLSVFNPVGIKLGTGSEEKIAAVYAAGLGYDASPQLHISAEIQKTEDLPLTVNAGLQYAFATRLLARAGVSTATSVYFIGFGVGFKNLRLDVTASVHPYLGYTPGLLLLYSPSK